MTEPGQISHDLVSLLDLFPTLIEAMELPHPGDVGDLAGESLYRSQVEADNSSGHRLGTDRERIFIDLYSGEQRWVSVRSRQQKYVAWASGEREELYDLAADPQEHIT